MSVPSPRGVASGPDPGRLLLTEAPTGAAQHPGGSGGGVSRAVVMVGELDLASGGHLGAQVRQLHPRLPARLVMDLGGCTFIDVAGTRALIALTGDLAAHGCHLVLTGLRPLHRLVLEITDLDRYLHTDHR